MYPHGLSKSVYRSQSIYGPLMANVFLCHLEDELTRDGVMPTFYKRYVDDTLARMPSTDAAVDFLTTLNSLHPSLSFTVEPPVDNKISFIDIEIIKNRTKIDTQVYRKPTNTGLLLHFQSHTDKRYKDCLLKTMIHRAYALSSTTEAFDQECTRLRSIFTRLDYPLAMINSIITKTIQSLSFGTREKNKEDSSVVRVILPFKDQTSANAVRRQMRDLSHKIGTTLQPVFTSRQLEQDLVSLAAVFWAVTQRSTQKKRLLTSELHSFLIVLAVCLRSFEQTNHVKMGLTGLRDSRCVSVVLIKAFLVLRLQACL